MKKGLDLWVPEELEPALEEPMEEKKNTERCNCEHCEGMRKVWGENHKCQCGHCNSLRNKHKKP